MLGMRYKSYRVYCLLVCQALALSSIDGHPGGAAPIDTCYLFL